MAKYISLIQIFKYIYINKMDLIILYGVPTSFGQGNPMIFGHGAISANTILLH